MNSNNKPGKQPLWMEPDNISPQSPINSRSVNLNRKGMDQRAQQALSAGEIERNDAHRFGQVTSNAASPTGDWEGYVRGLENIRRSKAKGNKGGGTFLRENMGT